jgi:hypothetical protein
MSSKRREYHVDYRTKKAALFFVACDANPDTIVKITNAMRIKEYSPSEAADQSLQQQVRREADKIKGEAVPGPSAPAAAVAASALLTLSTTANVGRPALQTITTVPEAVFVLPAAGVAALPLPPRKTRKTLHQEQIARQNERKHRTVHAQAHTHATTLIAEERAKEKENRHRTDRDDPNFDAFADVQSQNYYSTTQFTMMGYKGEMLRAQYHKDKVRALRAAAPVTVAHTRKCQEALAAATTHGKMFFMTGGEHITLDDMFKSAEIVRQNAELVEVKKDKKRRLEYRARRKAALLVLDCLESLLENAVTRLTGKELEVLLRWKGVPVSKMGDVANRRVLYQQFADEGEEEEDDVSIPAPWTDDDEAGLVVLRNAPIEMADTSYGRFLTTDNTEEGRREGIPAHGC